MAFIPLIGTGDGTFQVPQMDAMTRALTTISYAHHEIHGGSGFSLAQSTAEDALDIAAPLTVWIITPNTTKWAHMTWELSVATMALFEIFEDNGNAAHFDISGGSAGSALNANRNSTKSSGLTLATGVTITAATADVLIYSTYLGGFKQAGTSSKRHEVILKQNTEYLFKLTSIADNNEGSLVLDWYEHTNKTP